MTAIDKAFCQANAISCGVIQNVLEKAPGLVFVNGEFRHKYSLVSPSPPPLPSPPPRLFDYAPKPPSPPPPPGTPPPYYSDAEDCLPLPRLTDYGLDITTDAVRGAVTEERASCLFARRVLGTFEPLTSHTTSASASTSTRQNSCAPSWQMRSGGRTHALRALRTRNHHHHPKQCTTTALPLPVSGSSANASETWKCTTSLARRTLPRGQRTRRRPWPERRRS